MVSSVSSYRGPIRWCWGAAASAPGLSSSPEVPRDHRIFINRVVVLDPVFSDPERLALAGFLAGHRGLTRDAYALDLRQFMVWCDQH